MVDTQDTSDNRTTHRHKLLDCDIVMAGGVTSGIIYPGAVAMIARRYSFKSIGGTSVGAIAATVTAAAEYGRRTGHNSNAFEQVAALPKSLGDAADDGHSRLFHLFTPEASTNALFALVMPIFGSGGLARQIADVFKVGLSAWQVWVPVVAAVMVGLAMVISLLADGHPFLSAVGLVATTTLALVVWTTTVAFVLKRLWLPAWRDNGYGICTGLQSPQCGKKVDQADFEGLTLRSIGSSKPQLVDNKPISRSPSAIFGAPPCRGPPTHSRIQQQHHEPSSYP